MAKSNLQVLLLAYRVKCFLDIPYYMNLAGMAEHGRCKLNILHDPVFTMKRDILPGPFINFYCLSVHTRGIPCIILLNDALLSFYFYESQENFGKFYHLPLSLKTLSLKLNQRLLYSQQVKHWNCQIKALSLNIKTFYFTITTNKN